MIANHQQLLVSLAQLQELELALASVRREASSPTAFLIQATPVQREICRIRNEIDTYLGVADLQIAAAVENTTSESMSATEATHKGQRLRSLLELEGLGASLWQGIDAQHYVDELRKEWDQRP